MYIQNLPDKIGMTIALYELFNYSYLSMRVVILFKYIFSVICARLCRAKRSKGIYLLTSIYHDALLSLVQLLIFPLSVAVSLSGPVRYNIAFLFSPIYADRPIFTPPYTLVLIQDSTTEVEKTQTLTLLK